MESQDKEKEYEQNVWEIYRREWATANREKRLELNKQMLRWQKLMKNGLPASQAYFRAMQEESDKPPIYTAIEEESDYRVVEEASDKHPAIPSGPRMRKAPFVFLSLALVAAIVYGFVITGNRNALNIELQSVKSELASTQAELRSTKQTLASVGNKLEAAETKLQLYKDTLGIDVFSGVQPRIQKGNLGLLRLNNTTTANNPSWQQLISFLLADPTDGKYYSASFDCVDFAEMLHNNAEAAGIKAAFVAVDFENDSTGHALNAFRTTDKGLVYVDCTGKGLQTTSETLRMLDNQQRTVESDKIAFVVKDKEYGLISLEQDTPIDYASYEKMKADWDSYDQKLESYNQEIAEYNKEISGKTYYIGTTQWSRIKKWETTLEEQERVLDSLRAQLEDLWKPMGIVESIKIYW